MQRHRSDVSGVILKGTLASSQHRNRTFKPLQKLRKSRNFALCLIDDFVFSKLFYTLFFVAILLIFNQFYKVTKYGAEKATEGLVQQLSFRCVRSTNNENPVERKLRELFAGYFPTLWVYRQKIFRDTSDFEKSLFFVGDFGGFFLVLLCFLSRLDIKSLTQIR